MLIHGIAVVEVPDDQAVHQLEFREQDIEHPGFAHALQGPVGVRQEQDLPEVAPLAPAGGDMGAERRQMLLEPQLGLRRERQSVPGLEHENEQRELGRGAEGERGPEIHAALDDGEVAVRQLGLAAAQDREQGVRRGRGFVDQP